MCNFDTEEMKRGFGVNDMYRMNDELNDEYSLHMCSLGLFHGLVHQAKICYTEESLIFLS